MTKTFTERFDELLLELRRHRPRNYDKPWLTIDEACDYLGVSRSTFKRHVRARVATQQPLGIKRVLVAKSSLDELLNNKCIYSVDAQIDRIINTGGK